MSNVSVLCDIAPGRPVWMVMVISADSATMEEVESLAMIPVELSGDIMD